MRAYRLQMTAGSWLGKIKACWLAMFLLLAGATSADPARTNDSAPISPRVLGGWNFLTQYKDFELPFWAEDIKRLSQGKINAEVTSISTLGLRGSEVIRLLKLGEYDFGTTVLAYGSGADAIMEGPDLAGLNIDIATARRTTQAFKPTLNQYFERKYGIKVLGLWPYPAQIVYCKTSLKSLAELKGRQVRVGTRPVAELIEALGGIAINIPFGDAYEKIKAGTIDCAVTGSLPGNQAKLHEITQYLYPLPLGWSMSAQLVNVEYWNSLPREQQNQLESGIDAMLQKIWDVAERDSAEGIRCNIGQEPCKQGLPGKMHLIAVTEKDRLLLNQVLRQVILPRWAERCGPECATQWQDTVGKEVGIQRIRP